MAKSERKPVLIDSGMLGAAAHLLAFGILSALACASAQLLPAQFISLPLLSFATNTELLSAEAVGPQHDCGVMIELPRLLFEMTWLFVCARRLA